MRENSFAEVVGWLREVEATKRDYLTDSRNLRVGSRETGLALGGLNGDLGITEEAHRQLADKFDIPWQYYRRVWESNPELLAENVNHWFTGSPKRVLVRTAFEKCRAILADRYRPLDHLDVLPHVLNRVEQYPQARIERCALDERKMYLAVTNPMMRRDIAKVGDTVEAGFILSNSETGHAALTVQPRLLRLSCTNGMVVPQYAFRQVHLGRTLDEELLYSPETKALENETVLAKVRDVVDTVFDVGKFLAITDQLRDAARNEIPHPVELVNRMAEGIGFSQEVKNEILGRWTMDTPRTESGAVSQYGLSQAITRVAQDVGREDFERRIEMEVLGGKVATVEHGRLMAIVRAESAADGKALAERLFRVEDN